MKKCMHVLIGLTAALLFAAAMSSCKGAVSQTDAAASAATSAQDKAAVAKAKAKLEIGYRSGDSKESVTQPLTAVPVLPLPGNQVSRKLSLQTVRLPALMPTKRLH